MTRDELNNAYFDWMYQLVCDDEYSRGLSYRKLLYLLHDTDFEEDVFAEKYADEEEPPFA